VRHSHCSLTPGVVHHRARQALAGCLDWKPVGRSVSVPQLLDLLLVMAATAASLFAVARRFFPFSHETARRAVRGNLPGPGRLVAGLVGALHDTLALSRQDRRRHWLVGIDTHHKPYYGRRTPAVVGGPKKHGTKWSFGYATAVLLHDRRRYTVGLCPLGPGMTPDAVVRTLLDQVAEQGLKVRGVALDSGFEGGEVILLLQGRGLAYVVPLRRTGRKGGARQRLFEGRHRLVRWAGWTTDRTRQKVRTRTVLWRGRRRTHVFAFGGWAGDRARGVHDLAARQRRLYRRRFGIETSYRQKNQAEPTTTGTDPAYRLLLEGVAYLLRQVWVVLTAQIARGRRLRPGAWVGELTFARLLDWLAHALHRLYPERRPILVDPYAYAQ
jgi:hypothetical protein